MGWVLLQGNNDMIRKRQGTCQSTASSHSQLSKWPIMQHLLVLLVIVVHFVLLFLVAELHVLVLWCRVLMLSSVWKVGKWKLESTVAEVRVRVTLKSGYVENESETAQMLMRWRTVEAHVIAISKVEVMKIPHGLCKQIGHLHAFAIPPQHLN